MSMTIEQAYAVSLDPTSHPPDVVARALVVYRQEYDRVESHGREDVRQRMLMGGAA